MWALWGVLVWALWPLVLVGVVAVWRWVERRRRARAALVGARLMAGCSAQDAAVLRDRAFWAWVARRGFEERSVRLLAVMTDFAVLEAQEALEQEAAGFVGEAYDVCDDEEGGI